MSGIEQFPCFGIEALGACVYNPANPGNPYLSLGEAVAALALTFAIQQFIKPIYTFRLRCYGIRLRHLLALVLLGFLCSIVAATLPSMPVSRQSAFAFPIFWELVGTILIGCAYIVSALVALVPAQLYNFNLLSFIRAGATLLSGADDADRVAFAEDLLAPGNLDRLITAAAFWRVVEAHEAHMEFERLRSIGAPLQISGRPPVSAFFRFTHRREIERASWAGDFLRIISDPQFCSALVRKSPWLVAGAIQRITQKELHAPQAEAFIQEVARQAVGSDDSMMAREIGYDGFSNAPLLSNSLFGNWFFLSRYRPLGKLRFDGFEHLGGGYIARLNRASEMMLTTALDNGDYWQEGYMHDVRSAYENLFMGLALRSHRAKANEAPLELHLGVPKLYRVLLDKVGELEPSERKSLFVRDPKDFRTDLVGVIAEVLFDSFEAFANDFSGPDDPAWSYVIRIYSEVFPSWGDQPHGLNPLQQQFGLKLLEKLSENMRGWYPSVSRILLSVVGPYEAENGEKRTGHTIMRDGLYLEMKNLAVLYKNKGADKALDFLPPHVKYDPEADTLTHTYRNGKTSTTELSKLAIPPLDLLSETLWQA